MIENIVEDLGENYEYVKTIVDNEIEIKKLEAVETSSKITGKIVTYAVVGFIAYFLLLTLVVLVGVLLFNAMGSATNAILVLCGIMLALIAIIFIFRKQLIINPITNAFYKLLN